MTQDERAHRLGVPLSTVARWESGRCLPNAYHIGEIGLSGEVRPVSQAEARLKEAAKLGFERALLPRWRRKKESRDSSGMTLREIRHLVDLFDFFEEVGR